MGRRRRSCCWPGALHTAPPTLDQWPGSVELLARHADHDRAQDQARVWFDTLELDVAELDAVGIAGKKKLAELLTAYSVLLRQADAADRALIQARVRRLAAQTSSPAYHQLATASDAEFDANSMSYLRVLWLLSGFDLELADYRDQVLAIKPRLDARLAARGPWQRAMFRRYYSGLDLEAPAALADADMSGGVIARRQPLSHYLQLRRLADGGVEGGPAACYALTHEILVAFHYGEDLDQTVFDADRFWPIC